MVTPSCRTEQIAQLISTVDRYNPNNCHLLEDYLNEQLADNTYDLIANLALLKLYQASEPDVPAPAGEKETAELLLHLSTLVRARKFKAFWAALRNPQVDGQFSGQVKESVKRLVGSAKGFEATLRSEIAREVEASFVAVKRATLESFLGLEANSSELESIVSSNGWTLDGAAVKIPKNDSNSPASSVQREKIEIDQLSKLLGRSQA